MNELLTGLVVAPKDVVSDLHSADHASRVSPQTLLLAMIARVGNSYYKESPTQPNYKDKPTLTFTMERRISDIANESLGAPQEAESNMRRLMEDILRSNNIPFEQVIITHDSSPDSPTWVAHAVLSREEINNVMGYQSSLQKAVYGARVELAAEAAASRQR